MQNCLISTVFMALIICGINISADTQEVSPGGEVTDIRFFDTKVGAGTQTPASIFEIQKYGSTFTYTTNANATLFLGRRYNDDMSAFGMGYDASHIWHLQVGSNGKLLYYYYNGSSWYQYFTITSAGDIGMGIASPGAKLDVVGALRLTNASANSDIQLNSATRPTIYTDGPNTPANLDFQIRSKGTGTLQLNADNSGNVTMVIGGGRVGVGVVPASNSKLHVNGNMRVGGSNGPYICLARDGYGYTPANLTI